MSSSKNYKEYILEQLNSLGNITYKPMMGEYLLYYKNILFGGIYDDRLLIKKVNQNKKYNLNEAIPYETGKPMYYIEETDNKEELNNIILDTVEGLKQ